MDQFFCLVQRQSKDQNRLKLKVVPELSLLQKSGSAEIKFASILLSLKQFMYKFLYNSEIIFDFVILHGSKNSIRKFKSNWQFRSRKSCTRAVPVMTVIGLLLLVFLVILLQIYNQSLLLQGFSVDWNGN